MALDRRESAVYVDIEDYSYVAAPIETGRSSFVVSVCPRGKHNRVVPYTSQAEFHKATGQPNYLKTTLSHYIADKVLQTGGTLLHIRVVPTDAKLANVSIMKNTTSISTVGDSTSFTFFEFTTLPPKLADYATDKLYMTALNVYNTAYLEACKVNVAASVLDEVNIGDWLFCNASVTPAIPGDSYLEAVQVISKNVALNQIILEKPYAGASTGWISKTSSVSKWVPFVKKSDTNISWDTVYRTVESLPDPTNTLYTFLATGAGSSYNNLKIKGARNTDLEKLYTDDDGNVKFQFMFMNIGVYDINDEGQDKLVEGPWLVSLVKNTPEGLIVRDPATASPLFIQEVINKNSELIICVAGEAVQSELVKTNTVANNALSEKNRFQTMLQMAYGTPVGTKAYIPLGNCLDFENGFDGTTNGQSLYSSSGYLYQSEQIWSLCKQAYMGTLLSVDGSIEQLPECIYPWYTPDYVLTGGFPIWVQEGGRELAANRRDVFHIADTGYKTKYEQDLVGRLEEYPWNDWTSMLYTQYRKMRDDYTGEWLWMSPVYHAAERHIYCDDKYFISEPVANIEKGAISDQIELAYMANHAQRGDLQDKELNFTIVEPGGKYFNSQFTTYKRLSILKRAHAAKFVCYLRKTIPPILKDILQRKGTPYWINQAKQRVEYFLSKFTNPSMERYYSLTTASIEVNFDEVASELNVRLKIKPIRSIERINVTIAVY